jgi:hypothetical protein
MVTVMPNLSDLLMGQAFKKDFRHGDSIHYSGLFLNLLADISRLARSVSFLKAAHNPGDLLMLAPES